MILLLLIAAFATDLGAWYRQGQSQQRTADVGSLNGIQAYQAEVRADFDDKGKSAWTELTAAQRQDLEEKAMTEALATIIGIFEASGISVSNPPTYLIVPPPTGESQATVTADDGTEIQIVRTLDAQMVVTVSKPGAQYFSSLVRDAPEITRESSSTLSNCGAVCKVPIVLNAPFAGFQATGRGDGYGPLLYGDDEIWAVNHHNRGTEGDIICMDRDTEKACRADGNHYNLSNHKTGNRPVEYIDEANGKIYFTSAIRGDDRSGLACFDVVARAFCGKDFIDVFDYKGGDAYPNVINVTGPWEYNGRLYIITQDGQMACVTKGMELCGEWKTGAYGDTRLPGLNTTGQIVHGEQLGSKVYLSHDTSSGQLFHCWDFATNSSCWAGVQFAAQLGAGGDDHLTHFRYDDKGNEIGICTTDIIQRRNACVNLAGTAQTELTALSTYLAPLDQSWGGDTITWENKLTFFAGGNSDRVGCWNWETNSGCGIVKASDLVEGNKTVNPYGFAQVSAQCILGLGHNSIFYSFNPVGMTACVDTEVETTIKPCTCVDGSNKWGEVRVPLELMGMVDSLHATVTEPGGKVVLDNEDLVANGGIMDLGGASPAADELKLKLVVNAKLEDGKPIWTEPITADLELVVQPTLTD